MCLDHKNFFFSSVGTSCVFYPAAPLLGMKRPKERVIILPQIQWVNSTAKIRQTCKIPHFKKFLKSTDTNTCQNSWFSIFSGRNGGVFKLCVPRIAGYGTGKEITAVDMWLVEIIQGSWCAVRSSQKLYQGMTLVTNINLSLKMSSWVGEITEQELGWVELEWLWVLFLAKCHPLEPKTLYQYKIIA